MGGYGQHKILINFFGFGLVKCGSVTCSYNSLLQ